MDISIFKAYDIRGIYKTQIDADLVYKIAQAYLQLLLEENGKQPNACTIAVGNDMRLSGEEFKAVIIKSLTDVGVKVIDVGLVSTDQLYFAAATLPVDGGLQVTASHNPKEYAGLKMVRAKGAPVSGDSGIYKIRDLVSEGKWEIINKIKGSLEHLDINEAYFKHVLSLFNISKFKPFKIVANANFGMANPAINKLKTVLPVEFLEVINGHLDGNFPKGPSDPLLISNRTETSEAIKNLKPDFGVAWDGDADRFFCFDENGEFITPAYISALLAEYYLKKNPGCKILHDTRVVRVIDYIVNKNNGVSIMNKAGHSFIKERMAKDGIVFGCETSGHYFFKDNFYLDNGIIPFLAILEIVSEANKPFSEILKPLREKFFISDEINFKVKDSKQVLEAIKADYKDAEIGQIDGFDFSYPEWRFNLRLSNTEPLIRLNIEADSKILLENKIHEIREKIEKFI